MKKRIRDRGDKDKRGRTTLDDVDGKSVSEKSKTVGGKCVGENTTGGKSCVVRSSDNIFEVSRRDKTPHTHTLPTHSLTHPYIYTFFCVSHTNTLEVLLNLQHLISGPTYPISNLVHKWSLLIRS
jgi:hypothetical protein